MATVILKPYGFSDILFAIKLAKQIPLGVSRISLRSNRTRRRRIKLPNFLMRSWAKQFFFILSVSLLNDESCAENNNNCNAAYNESAAALLFF